MVATKMCSKNRALTLEGHVFDEKTFCTVFPFSQIFFGEKKGTNRERENREREIERLEKGRSNCGDVMADSPEKEDVTNEGGKEEDLDAWAFALKKASQTKQEKEENRKSVPPPKTGGSSKSFLFSFNSFFLLLLPFFPPFVVFPFFFSLFFLSDLSEMKGYPHYFRKIKGKVDPLFQREN